MSQISNIDCTYDSYQRLVSFYEEQKDKWFETVNVELRGWFAANMSAALGATLDILQDNLNNIEFSHIDPAIETILLKNEFLTYYGFSKIDDNYRTTVRFKKLKTTDGKHFSQYVKEELLGRQELPQMSPLLKEKMAEAIYEIFVNAQIHSNTQYIYTCGQFYPKENKIEFTIVDTGIGFKRKVNERFGSNLSSVQAIQWAVKDKSTTKEGITGGIGLALLKEFIKLNNGRMQIASGDGFYQFDKLQEWAKPFKGSFPGTIVNLQFRTDDHSSYILKNEVDPNEIF